MAGTLPYISRPRKVDTVKAKRTVRVRFLPNAADAKFLKIAGKCPRCKHDLVPKLRAVSVVSYGGGRGGGGGGGASIGAADKFRADTDLDIDYYDYAPPPPDEDEWTWKCNCETHHSWRGHPKEKTVGCGAEFNLRIKWPR